MRKLEERYPDEIAIVGVHSGKYTAERDTSRIRDASIRLGSTHPTINDRQFRLWRAYAVRAWPTLVAVDPRGYVIGMHAGEFSADSLAPFIDRSIATARAAGTLVPGRLHHRRDLPTTAPATLSFPGKVSLDGRRLAIADSAHRRVLVGTLDDTGQHMRVDHTVDGIDISTTTSACRPFINPQGVVLLGNLLYVADAGRHTILECSLRTGGTRIVAGTGHQLRSAVDEAQGALSSPWDLALDGDTLFVAMAGVHQLWTVSVSSGRAEVFSGSGAEELYDGSHDQAALAQPMGICLANHLLYVTDAESSAIRVADRDPSGGVRTIVGTGLFDFGDVDGVGDAARMQHQQGIALAGDGRLLVCDSYNDALKWVDPVTRRADTWVRGLHEPSGLAIGERFVYVADTNAHRVAVIDRRSGQTGTLLIE